MKTVYHILVGALLFAVSLGQNAEAQVEEHLGPVASSVTLGVDGAWEAKLQDGWFNLFNLTDPGSVQYYYMTEQPVGAGERVMNLTVLVRAAGNTPANAGIILNRSADDQYMAFTIADDGSANIFIRTSDGFERKIADNMTARLDGSDVLTIREQKNVSTLYLNDEVAFTIENPDGINPTYGIIAIGSGRFAFSQLSLNDTAASSPFPQPGGGTGGGEQPFPAPKTGGGGGSTPQPQPQPVPTPPPVSGPPASPQDIYVSQVLMGATLGVFFHEFGHALIGETGLPATGPEEDTADGFAAFVLGAMVEEGEFANAAEQEFAEKIAEYASLFWYYSGVEKAKSGQQAPWQGEHAPDLKRFRNSFCILYGSNPGRYEDIAQKVQLEQRTKDRCKQGFQKRYQAWEAILATVTRNLGPDSPGNHPADAPGGKILLSFQPSQNDTGKAVVRMLSDTGALASILKDMERLFVFPRDLQIEFRDCQEVNAWYDPQAGKVTMCYSITEAVSKLIFQSERGGQTGGGQTGGGQTGGGQTGGGQTGGGQTGGGQAQDPAAFLVGTWQASFQSDAGMINMTVVYSQNGQFQSSAVTPNGPFQVAGTWQAQMAGQNMIAINLNPTQWSPQQICDNFNNCQPNQQYPEKIQVQVTGQNSVTTDGVTWQRSR